MPPSPCPTLVLAGNSLCFGGAERQLVGLALGFHARGWRVRSFSLFETPHAPPYERAVRGCGIRPVRASAQKPNEAFIEQTRRFLDNLSPELAAAMAALPRDPALLVAQAALFLRRAKPDLVIAYLDWPSVIVGLAALFVGLPRVILSARSMPPTLFPHFYKPEALPFFRAAYRCLAKAPQQIVLANNGLAPCAAYEKWLGLAKGRVAFVPNGIAEDFFQKPSAAERKTLRETLSLGAKDQILLGVFRLSVEKRPEKFLALFEKLAKDNPRLHAVLCGDGPLREALQKQAARKKLGARVHLLGNVENVRDLMAISALLLHTSKNEGMPNAMIEAQAQGLPVVSTRVGGVPDTLAPELQSLCLPKNDWAGLEKACRKLLKNPARRKSLGTAARNYAKKTFGMNKLISRYLALAKRK